MANHRRSKHSKHTSKHSTISNVLYSYPHLSHLGTTCDFHSIIENKKGHGACENISFVEML